MKKSIVLLTWPRHWDFPLCRWNLERFKKYFASIWIGFSNHHVENQDFRGFVRERLPFANFVDVERTGNDWRNDAVNQILEKIESDEPILFLEQDFLIKDNTFFEKLLYNNDYNFLYYQEEDRIHPAFALMKRELIEKTSKDFSVSPPGDHFYKFFNELPKGTNIEELGVKNRDDFYHMGGLSQNYRNFQYGDPFYHAARFLYFNWKSLQFPNQHPLFYQIQQQIERVYGHPPKHALLDKFFPHFYIC